MCEEYILQSQKIPDENSFREIKYCCEEVQRKRSKSLCAPHLKQGAIERPMRYDEGFKFLRVLRGSPPYFEKAKKDLFAMIRQLGSATIF